MMRNPLQRRMFMNPQQRRGMARMPQGILASGPRIMNAAMQQQAPVRMQSGGMVPTGDFPGAEDVPSLQPGDVNFAPIGSSRLRPGSVLDRMFNPAPGPGMSMPGEDFSPAPLTSTAAPSVTTGIPDSSLDESAVPAPNQGGSTQSTTPVPTGGPANEEQEIIFLGPEDENAQGGDTTPPAANNDPVVPPDNDPSYFGDLGGNQQEERGDPYKKIFDMLNAQMPEGKSTEKYIDEATDLLKKYGIEAGDRDEMKRMRIMEFFLNMAAGESPDFLTNVADAGKETFKGYAKDIRDLNARDQELKLAGIQMGLSEKGKADATRQAINLKKIEVVGDATKELLSLADKSKQVDYLMRVGGKSRDDAIALVYSGNDKKLAFELEYSGLRAGNVSPFLATQIAGNSIDLTAVAGDTTAALNALQGILASGPPGEADLALLGLLTGQGRIQARQAIEDAGYEDEAARLLP